MFKNRQEAGHLLAERLKKISPAEAVVLGLTRGGVVVAREIAQALKIPLDILVVKKIGAPGQEELAIGAVGPEGVVVWDEELCQRLGVDEKIKKEKLKIKNEEREEAERLLRGKEKPLDLGGKTVILADDGIATGASVEAAVAWIKTQNPQKIILAVPVAPPDAIEKLRPEVDDIICLQVESEFWAVGQFYKEFSQVSDEEVIKIYEANCWSR